jgi:hypothetical protein
VRTIHVDAAAGRLEDRFLHPVEVSPTRVPARNRWLGLVVGLMVAIVSFGFGSSLAAAPSTEEATQQTGVAAVSPAIQWNRQSRQSIVVRESSRDETVLLSVSILSQPSGLQIDVLAAGAVTSVLISVTDRVGNVLATSTADAHALPSVLTSDPMDIGLSAMSALLPLSNLAPIDEVLVDLVAV